MAMGDEEDFERTFLEPLSYSFDSSSDSKKEIHMGGDADNNINGRLHLDKFYPVPPFNEMTVQTLKLKSTLKNWKEVMILLKKVLLWEKEWYPEGIVGVSIIIITIFYLATPSTLTTIAILGLIVTLMDYLVPIFAASYFKPENWSNECEQDFEELCRRLVEIKTKVSLACQTYFFMRRTKPKVFYSGTIATLVFLSWIGCVINNWILTYLLVNCLLLWPGAEHNGVLERIKVVLSNLYRDIAEKARTKLGTGNASFTKKDN